jgi:hypothetical protein
LALAEIRAPASPVHFARTCFIQTDLFCVHAVLP